jgi:hypothetical protein
MDAMRSSIDEKSYSVFDATLAAQISKERMKLEAAVDARPIMESAIRATVKEMRERRYNESVTGVTGFKEAIAKGRQAARRNVTMDTEPLIISQIQRDDEAASVNSAITGDSQEDGGVDVESLRDEMSVGTAVEHAARTGTVQSVVNTFKTHYDSEHLWDNEDFCILVCTLQFTTERVSTDMDPRNLGQHKPNEYPTFHECDAKREPLPDHITTEKIKAEVEAMFTAEISQVAIREYRSI